MMRIANRDTIITTLRLAAARGEYDGTERTLPYLMSCAVESRIDRALMFFTRDVGHHTSGWFKNPDYERCLHLSISFRDTFTGENAPHDRRRADQWARDLFGADVARKAWLEPPATSVGKAKDVWHYRVFCDEHWQPILPRGEVYSTELTELGWQSCSELGRDVSSPLLP